MRAFLKEVLFITKTMSKAKLALLALCIGFTAIFEVVGIAFIIPFITLIANPDILYSSKHFQALNQFFGYQDPNKFITVMGIAFFILIVAGNLFSAFTAWFSARFGYIEGYKLGVSLLKKYLTLPYSFFFQRNSRELIKVILVDIDRVVVGIVVTGIHVITKVVIVSSIFILLVCVDPKLAILSSVLLGGTYVIAYKLIKRTLTHAGKDSAMANVKQHKAISEALDGVKEIKVLGQEQTFVSRFSENALVYVKAEAVNHVSPFVTRYVLEMVAIGGMLLVVLILFKQKGSLTEILPLLSLYAFASYRLLPAMQQIFSGATLTRYYRACLQLVYSELKIPENIQEYNSTAQIHFTHEVKLENVSYQYPNSSECSLKKVSLSIPHNSTVAFVGHTGSGKSTLADIILGLLEPTQGKLTIDNQAIDRLSVRSWQEQIGYVPQKIFLMDDTIEKNIALGLEENQIDQEKLIKASKLANLHEFVSASLPLQYKTVVGENGIRLSGGQRQRIGIARALYRDPSVLIFDEATSALDNVTENVIMQAINELAHKKTIIIIAHRISTVRSCDQIFLIQDGEIVSRGNFDYLMDHSEIFKQIARVA